MKTLILDTETDIFNKGNPFDDRNSLVCVSYKYLQDEADAERWNEVAQAQVRYYVDTCDLVVGFNFKFDYHWLYNHGITFDGKRIWDCQTAHYILNNQQTPFPSMDSVCDYYGIAGKLDVVKTEYWDRGITTRLVPWSILRPYAIRDAELTHQIFLLQWEQATPKQRALILLDGQDSHVLREMEYNGIPYDAELCETRSKELDVQQKNLQDELQSIYKDVPINFASGDHLSAFLYGGIVRENIRVFDGYYKTGLKKGEPKYKWEEIEHTLPRLYTPVKGSELKKEGFYATNEPTLRKLKGKMAVINTILALAKIEKINGTYYKGLPKLNAEMNWKKGVLHSNFNQTQTITGRLSSSKPNQQNFASELQDIFVSKETG